MQPPKTQRTLSLREVYGCDVRIAGHHDSLVCGEKNLRVVGQVEDVLFDPRNMRVIGFSIRPSEGILNSLRLFASAQPKHRYLRRDVLELTSEGVFVVAKQALRHSSKNAQAADGLTWDDTVVFYSMPLVTASGQRLGKVADARFFLSDGTLTGVECSSGATSDVSLGKRIIPISLIERFHFGQHDDEPHCLVCDEQASECVHPGGLAAHAGVVAAKAGALSGRAQAAAGALGSKMTRSVSKSVAKTLTHKSGRKAVKRAKGLWTAFSDGYQEGLHSGEDTQQ